VLFYHQGEDVFGIYVLTIIKILGHMNIPCLWDEWIDLGIDLAKDLQKVIESCLDVQRLYAVLFGSSEASI